MAKKIHVRGYDEFKRQAEDQMKENELIIALFCGSKDANGESWCSDCVKAEPVIDNALGKAPSSLLLIHCEVGDRATWKDPANRFRKDPEINLTSVPTLIKLGSKERLVENQCANRNLVAMIFEED